MENTLHTAADLNNNGHFKKIHTDATSSIISSEPGFIVKWGITVFLFLLLSFSAITFFIKYPSITKINITITTSKDPKTGGACYIATGLLQQQQTLLVKPNQKVSLKLTGYPFAAFGSIEGSVTAVSESLNTDPTVSISLPAGLTTNQHIVIDYRQGLAGTAEIVTSNSSLGDKLFEGIIGKR